MDIVPDLIHTNIIITQLSNKLILVVGRHKIIGGN